MILAEDEKPDPILEEAVDWLLKPKGSPGPCAFAWAGKPT